MNNLGPNTLAEINKSLYQRIRDSRSKKDHQRTIQLIYKYGQFMCDLGQHIQKQASDLENSENWEDLMEAYRLRKSSSVFFDNYKIIEQEQRKLILSSGLEDIYPDII